MLQATGYFWEYVGGIFDGSTSMGSFEIGVIYYWHYTLDVGKEKLARTAFYQCVPGTPRKPRPHLAFLAVKKGLCTQWPCPND